MHYLRDSRAQFDVMGYGDHREAHPEDARSVVVPAPESATASVQS